MKKNCKNQIKKNLEQKKKLRKNKISYMVNVKAMIREIQYKMSQYFPKPSARFSKRVKVELDLSNHATKADLKEATEIDTSFDKSYIGES